MVLVAGTSAVYASRTSVPLLIPAIAKEKNWSRTDSGAVLSSFFWGYILTQVRRGRGYNYLSLVCLLAQVNDMFPKTKTKTKANKIRQKLV